MVEEIVLDNANHVDAEVIENSIYPVGPQTVEPIYFAKDKALKWVRAQTDAFQNIEIDPSDTEKVKELKKIRASLNKKKTELHKASIAAKQPLRQAIQVFADDVADVEAHFTSAIQACDKILNTYKEMYQVNKLRTLEEHYEEFAGDFAEIIPFHVLMNLNHSWLNESVSLNKAMQELEALALQGKKDRELLDAMNLEYKGAALYEYSRTLDLHKAVEANNRKVEEQKQQLEYLEKARQIEEAHGLVEEQDTYAISLTITECPEDKLNQLKSFLKTYNLKYKLEAKKCKR